MIAYDHTNPDIIGRATIYLTVKRNQNVPTFNKVTYRTEIAPTYAQGRFILQVNATDDDDMVRDLIFVYEPLVSIYYNLKRYYIFVRG